MVRIEGFHSFGPGSIPGIGIGFDNYPFKKVSLWPYSPVVRTQDFESCNPSSILGRAYFAWMTEWLRWTIQDYVS